MHCWKNDIGASEITINEINHTSRMTRFFSIPLFFYRAIKDKSDIYHLHNPDTLPIGIMLKLCGKSVIYDTHENFRKKILLRTWIPRILRRFIADSVFYTEKVCSLFFDATIVTQKEQLSEYKKSYLVGNAPIIKLEDEGKYNKCIGSSAIKLVYLGGVSEDRGLSSMIKFCGLLNKLHPTELNIIGPCINSLTELEIEDLIHDFPNIHYHGFLNQSEAFLFVRNSHLGLIMLEDVADYKETNPNKLFEYMMLGTPFISSDFEKWKRLLGSQNAGFFLDSKRFTLSQVEYIYSVISSEPDYSKLVHNGRKFVTKEYNWKAIDEKVLLSVYKGILSK